MTKEETRLLEEVKALIISQQGEQQQRDLAIAIQLSSIDARLKTVNGTLELHDRSLQNLPCADHNTRLTVVESNMIDLPTPSEFSTLSERLSNAIASQLPPRESGKLEAEVEHGKLFRSRAWVLVSGILALILAIIVTAVLTGTL